MTIIGFSGTQVGCTDAQSVSLLDTFYQRGMEGLHHGDCIGGDVLAHCHARRLGVWVALHPPLSSRLRAFCPMLPGEVVYKQWTYLVRNRDIVGASEVLVACPKEETGGASHPDHLRSGTWSTVRYALKLERPIYIIRPSGTVEEWV